MSSYSDFLEEQLQDPAVKVEYDALEPEFFAAQAAIDERNQSVLTDRLEREELPPHAAFPITCRIFLSFPHPAGAGRPWLPLLRKQVLLPLRQWYRHLPHQPYRQSFRP